VSVTKINLDNTDYIVKNAIKESVDIGNLRLNQEITIDYDILYEQLKQKYFNDEKEYQIKVYQTDLIITVQIEEYNNYIKEFVVLNTFSYQFIER
ncbi:MAG: hypothetical protein R3Y21_03645, partial [Mycoplasmatota bacterium]